MLYKTSEIAGQAPSFIISQTDAFIVFTFAALLFSLLTALIVYHLNAYSLSDNTSRKIQFLYLLVSGVIILATASTIFFL